jgi:hypothetical protein
MGLPRVTWPFYRASLTRRTPSPRLPRGGVSSGAMEFVENPRRTPRAPIRCEARVVLSGGGFWSSPTHDLGPAGCQIAASGSLPAGTRLRMELTDERVPGPVRLEGSVVWSAGHEPWRTGVAFTPESAARARPFFAALLVAYPGLEGVASSPTRISLDAPLAPGPAPRVDPELAPEQAEVLTALGAGFTVRALRERLGPRFEPLRGLLFALLGHHQVVIGPPDPVTAAAWAAHLRRVGR